MFAIQVFFFRILMFLLLIGTKILPFRQPQLFTGPGSSLQLCEHIAKTGVKRLLVVTDAMLMQLGLLKPMLEKLAALGVTTVIYDGVKPDPTIAQIESGLELLRREKCTAILAVGGGSSIDAAKVIGARATNPHPISWMAGLFRLLRFPLPLFAVPTTAGTGSEVTIAAVVSDPANSRKFAIMDSRLVPVAAALDAQLMAGLPAPITAATGMDALTQLIEPYVSLRANPLTDALCVEGIRRAARSLQRAFDDGRNAEAREDMALASLFGGLALANAGLGAVHGFAAPLGGMFSAPHGAVCAALLPHVMEANLRALRERSPQSDTLRRFDEIARLLTSNPQATADDGVAWVRSLASHFQIPPLRNYGFTEQDIPDLVSKSRQASSMKANPIILTDEELSRVLKRAF